MEVDVLVTWLLHANWALQDKPTSESLGIAMLLCLRQISLYIAASDPKT